MKRLHYLSKLMQAGCALLCMSWPITAYADDAPPPLPPLIISEVQAGSAASASEEFIELTNTTAAAVDLSAHAWRVEIASSTATDWSTPLRSLALSGSLAAGQTYVLASQYVSGGQTVQYLPTVANQWFGAGIAATGGHVRVVYDAYQVAADGTCALATTAVDEVEWSAPKNGVPASPSLDGRAPFLTAKTTGLAAGSSLHRLSLATGGYIDTENDATDFAADNAVTPGVSNGVVSASPGIRATPEPGLPVDACSPVPADDGTDTGDDGDESDPDTGDDTSQPPDTDTPAEPESTPPTIPDADQGLQAPSITELLPNPGAPQTDAADEFIELYNPNAAPFDLTDFALQVGTTTKHTYVFPAGSQLAAGQYVAFFSATTGLSMANGGGQARLLDPLGTILAQTDVYGTAKDNQAWVLQAGSWQWSATPTPNAPNAVLVPAGAVKAASTKTSTKAAASKTSTAKTTKAKKVVSTSAASQVIASTDDTARTPLHFGILAAVGAVAVLYGAYEYRQDVANLIRRLRGDRAHRRAGGPESSGRRGG